MIDLKGKRVAAYARYSSDLQSDSSIQDQLDLLQTFVKNNGGRWKDVEVFSDAAVSGSTMRRKGLQEMRSGFLAKAPTFDVIVVESVDRISRDMADSARLFKELAFAGVRLIAVSDGIDTKDPSARLNYGFRAVMADQYVVDLGEKTRRGLHGRAARGFATGGLPFGYTSVRHIDERGKSTGSDIVIDDADAEVVRQIFKSWVDGMSCKPIAALLNQAKVPTPRGARKRNGRGWVDTTVRAILRNTAYIGEWSFGEKRWIKDPTSGKRQYRKVSEHKVQRFSRPHLAIIDQQTWKLAQKRIEETAGRYGPKIKNSAPIQKTRYPLSGILFCGACGAPMVVIGGSSARYYRCGDAHKRGTCKLTQPLRESQVSQAVIGLVRGSLHQPQGIAYLAEMLRRGSMSDNKDAATNLKAAERALQKVETRISHLVESIASGGLGKAALRHVNEGLEKEEAAKRELEVKIRECERALKVVKTTPKVAALTRQAEGMIQNFDLLVKEDPVRAREQLRRFIPRGRIVMQANDDGSWTAKFPLYPPVLVPKVTKGNGPGGSSEAVYPSGCAGWI